MNQKWQNLINSPKVENFNHYQKLSNVESLSSLLQKKYDSIILKSYSLNPGNVFLLKNVLSKEEVEKIYPHINQLNFFPVGYTGHAKDYKENDEISSLRASIYDIEFSAILFERMRHFLPPYISFGSNDYSVKVSSQNVNYHLLGVNPYHRIVKYTPHAKLVAHYDGHNVFDSDTQTIMTMLIYLTNNQTGDTVFLEDSQKFIPHDERKKVNINPEDEQIILAIKPKMGDVLLFNQHLLHSTNRLHFENKDLILTDLIATKF
jgi:hypothetical protein